MADTTSDSADTKATDNTAENAQKASKQSSDSSKHSKGRPSDMDRNKLTPLEVSVEHSIEKAMKILKRKLIKEGLFKELKTRRYYEKPSDKKKRKLKESLKKIRKEEARQKKSQGFF